MHYVNNPTTLQPSNESEHVREHVETYNRPLHTSILSFPDSETVTQQQITSYNTPSAHDHGENAYTRDSESASDDSHSSEEDDDYSGSDDSFSFNYMMDDDSHSVNETMEDESYFLPNTIAHEQPRPKNTESPETFTIPPTRNLSIIQQKSLELYEMVMDKNVTREVFRAFSNFINDWILDEDFGMFL
ncbi:hypothetical protein BJV82DRAFT_583731 [Fennellomyces sp. T-0311]|nr:hypothetical protein BJV82DRAFT_583731 [Fennellomyces sp. T-0311]